MIEVSAQSTEDVNILMASKYESEHTILGRKLTFHEVEETLSGFQRTKSALRYPPDSEPYSDVHPAMPPRFQRALALSMLGTICKGVSLCELRDAV